MNLSKKTYEPSETRDHCFGGSHRFFAFANGYGASVVSNPYSYGSDQGHFELAVLRGRTICYTTPITNDVIGHLTEEQVQKFLSLIEGLPNPNAPKSRTTTTTYSLRLKWRTE